MDTVNAKAGLAPFSLKDAPALIERVFPAQKVGIEAQKERKAVAGQTLTGLGAYWKGRKPLVLVRAIILASLLPATDEPEHDLATFEMLMRMDLDGLLRRSPKVTAGQAWASHAISEREKLEYVDPPVGTLSSDEGDEIDDSEDDENTGVGKAKWKPLSPRERATHGAARDALKHRVFLGLSFSQQVAICTRVEKIEKRDDLDDPFYEGIWGTINARIGTAATSLSDFIQQLGVARFGHNLVVGDPFCGGGSIPFEAARLGCDVAASDLNPVAMMLTWGGLNMLGAHDEIRKEHSQRQKNLAASVSSELKALNIENNADGDRAKVYLYCLEVVDPQTGWLVPCLPSLTISTKRRCVLKLVPDYPNKRFDIIVATGVPRHEVEAAAGGTLDDGYLVYNLAPVMNGASLQWRAPIGRLRGDGEGEPNASGERGNLLRIWRREEVAPQRPSWNPAILSPIEGALPGAWTGGDVWQERLYCIQWVREQKEQSGRQETYFAAPTEYDLATEDRVQRLVEDHIIEWQASGIVSDMEIETGKETEGPIRTNGWKWWHQLFMPRAILTASIIRKHIGNNSGGAFALFRYLDNASKACRWKVSQSSGDGGAVATFDSQALKTMFNWALRTLEFTPFTIKIEGSRRFSGTARLENAAADTSAMCADLFITDPPYADAVVYHEITEFFISWLRKNPPQPFNQWTWDSRRPLAIQGKGEKFRADMVAAFKAMAHHMPDNGLQTCMFTHKDAGVWADMAQMVWGAGLQVTAAWYVSTETTSQLKQGGYVQGTVLLVLRKRKTDEHGFRSDIVPEIRSRVTAQVDSLTGLNQKVRGRGRDENIFSDADIQMAGYAAALEVLTGYTHIDGIDMTREALRPRAAARNIAPSIVEEMIALAVQTANELMVPEGITEGMWERLSSTERFYLKMTGTEAAWPASQVGGKLDDYQNFARVYRAENWEDLMAERSPNKARLKGAADFRSALMTGHAFATGAVRPTLYAISEQWRATAREDDPTVSGDRILHGLRDHFGAEGWLRIRDNVRSLAMWFGRTWERQRAEEAASARVIAGLIASERLGG